LVAEPAVIQTEHANYLTAAIDEFYEGHMSQRTLPAGFISPCLPTRTDKLPSGSEWLHEIKHDGFRAIARKKGAQVRLYSRPGNDLTYRFPLIVETLTRLRSRSRNRAAAPRARAQLQHLAGQDRLRVVPSGLNEPQLPVFWRETWSVTSQALKIGRRNRLRRR
jgi:ATP dependent DNA ligase domain